MKERKRIVSLLAWHGKHSAQCLSTSLPHQKQGRQAQSHGIFSVLKWKKKNSEEQNGGGGDREWNRVAYACVAYSILEKRQPEKGNFLNVYMLLLSPMYVVPK